MSFFKFNNTLSFGNIIELSVIIVGFIVAWVILQGDVAKAGDLAKKNAQAIEQLTTLFAQQNNAVSTFQATVTLQILNQEKQMIKDREDRKDALKEIKDALNRIAPRVPVSERRYPK